MIRLSCLHEDVSVDVPVSMLQEMLWLMTIPPHPQFPSSIHPHTWSLSQDATVITFWLPLCKHSAIQFHTLICWPQSSLGSGSCKTVCKTEFVSLPHVPVFLKKFLYLVLIQVQCAPRMCDIWIETHRTHLFYHLLQCNPQLFGALIV